MYLLIVALILLIFPSLGLAVQMPDEDVQSIQFRGGFDSHPFESGQRLPFARPLDKDLPPLKKYPLPPRESPDFDEGRHEKQLREIEQRSKRDQERDFLYDQKQE